MNNWIQVMVGVAAIVAIANGLFRPTNKWFVTRIGTEVQTRLDSSREKLLDTLHDDYVTRLEFQLMQRHGDEIHNRHEAEFGKLWSEMNKRQVKHQ